MTAHENVLRHRPRGTGGTGLTAGPAMRAHEAGHRVLFEAVAAAVVGRLVHDAEVVALSGDRCQLHDPELAGVTCVTRNDD